MVLGPRTRRMLAAFIDLLLSVMCMLAGSVVALFTVGKLDSAFVPDVLLLVAVYLLILGPHAAYYIHLTASRGATLGKSLMKLAVVDATGNRPTVKTAAIRYAGQLGSNLLLGLGHLPALRTGNPRSLQDYVAGTRVVDALAVPAAAPVPPPASRTLRVIGLAAAGLALWMSGMIVLRFSQMLQYSREGATRGNLSALRSAISIYYGDTEGYYPASLSTAPDSPFSRYLEKIPAVTATHAGIGKGRAESPSGTLVLYTVNESITITGRGWRYNAQTGHVFVNSCATDMKGLPYSCYGY